MFRQNQAALFYISLLALSKVFAGHFPVVYRDKLVYRGESTSLTCNKSEADTTLIRWMKDSFILAHVVKINETSSNFPDRLRLDHNSPERLIISNTQDDDKGLYMCNLTGVSSGTVGIQWNLTVSEKPKAGEKSFGSLPEVITLVTGSLLVGIAVVVFLCIKSNSKAQNQDFICDSTLTLVQYQVQSDGEVHPQSCAVFGMGDLNFVWSLLNSWPDRQGAQIKTE